MVLLTLLTALATNLCTWQFAMEQKPHIMPAATDSVWQTVTIPHDWAISTPFDRQNDLQTIQIIQNGEQSASLKTGRTGGLNWIGEAWYRCTLPATSSPIRYLVFDGAMSRAEVYCDGQLIGYWPYGYNSFVVKIDESKLRSRSGEHELAVRLENLPSSSRWYPGAGIYRHVTMVPKAQTHIPIWGIHLTMPMVTDSVAILHIDVPVNNATRRTRVVTEIFDKQHRLVATIDGQHGTARIQRPHLWSPESPYLYNAYTRVYDRNQLCDIDSTVVGVRRIDYRPTQGFMLNGKVRKFRGVCLHHDLGSLGAAVDRDAILHQLTLLKDMGCDAIRTSHNMPAPELVELCEQMGLMMMIEPFDVWNWAKCKNDYSNFFFEWAEKDITNMIVRYRNSPAVVMWSTGNEVGNQRTEDGIKIATWLQDICHRLDSTRPVTCGMDQVKDVIYNGFAAVMDIPGFNYRTGRYVEAHGRLPHRLIVGSETASTVSSRGTYHFPTLIQPDALHTDGQSSGYDLEYCSWSGLPDQDFQLQDDYAWTIGQFVWTGQDYLGEPSPYDTDAWPSHSSYFGIIDLAMLPKDRFYLYRSQWNTASPTLHILPHWTWPGREGERTPVYVYTSYPSAELFINGESKGRLRFATALETERIRNGEKIAGVSVPPAVGEFEIPDWGTAPRPDLLPRYRLMWQDVVYQPGEIKVVAYNEQGQIADEQVVRTAGAPSALKTTIANENEPTTNGLRYITVQAVDSMGNICPNSDMMITLHSTHSTIIGAANGDPTCLAPLSNAPYTNHSFSMPLFHGEATFLVRVNTTDTLWLNGGGLTTHQYLYAISKPKLQHIDSIIAVANTHTQYGRFEQSNELLQWILQNYKLNGKKKKEIYGHLSTNADLMGDYAAYYQYLVMGKERDKESLRQAKALAELPKQTLFRPEADEIIPYLIDSLFYQGHYVGCEIRLPITIDGKSEQVLLDNGCAKFCAASESFAREHNIQPIGVTGTAAGVVSSVDMWYGIAQQMEIGNMVFRNLIFVVIPDSFIDNSILQVNAILGAGIFRMVGEMVFDNVAQTITIPHHQSKHDANMKIDVDGTHYVCTIVDGDTLWMQLDLGAVTTDLNGAYYERYKDIICTTYPRDTTHVGGVGGMERHLTYNKPELIVYSSGGTFTKKNVKIDPTEQGNEIHEYGKLGNDFLLSFRRVKLNLNRMIMIVEE